MDLLKTNVFYFASNSSYTLITGDENSGNVLILTDQQLMKRLSKKIPVYRPGQKEQTL